MKKIFLGPPGSGKGTAASRIAPKFNAPHISTGELFRQTIKEQAPVGIKIKEYMDKGELVPDDIVIEMLKKRISKSDCENGFILDGFPRTIPQAEKLKEITEINVVINMNVSDEIVIKRLCSRVTCVNCGEIYNLIGIPPKQEGICDKCSGELKQRDDEKPEVIQHRLNVYKKQTQPLIDFYKKQNLVEDAVCKTIEQTAEETVEQVLKAIEKQQEKNEKRFCKCK